MQKYKESILYILFVVIAIIFVIYRLQPNVVAIFDVESQLKAKNVESSDLDRKLETIKAANVEKELKTAGKNKKIYKAEGAGLDNESAFTVLFDDIVEMAKYNGVKIYSIEYVYDPQTDEIVKGAAGKYNVCQLNMQMIADYLDLEGFFKELYKYPYLLNVDKMEITSYEKNKKILLVNLQLKLYLTK